MKTCPICSGGLERAEKETTLTYKGKNLTFLQPGEYCLQCHEGFLSPADMKATKKEIVDFKREVDGYLKTSQIKKIRKKLHLTQKAAAQIFGGGERSFYKYETGEVTQNKPLDLLLRLFDKEKISLSDLK